VIKKLISNLFDVLGCQVHRGRDPYEDIAVELTDIDVDLIKYVHASRYSMASIPRLVNTLKACKYVVENKIPGDFVECGVWRGGNGILAKKTFQSLGSTKKVWMFDTFEGMTAPTSVDVSSQSQTAAESQYVASQKETHNEWCYASLNDVKKNCTDSGLDMDELEFIQGDVFDTLRCIEKLPDEISVLRLDTDWYESTKFELETLYPRLSQRGVLIIDDYGYWEGARKAVDEFFLKMPYKPLFNVVDSTGRSAIKSES